MRASRIVRVALLLALAPPLMAQTGTVMGRVLHAGTSAPIDGAIVSIGGTPLTAVTGANGAFTILSVPSGTYVISAKRFGFATSELVGVEMLTGRDRVLTFLLRESATDTTDTVIFAPAIADRRISRIATSLSRDQLITLPTMSMSNALGVGGGYLELPRSGALLSIADFHRGLTGLASVRGGRPEATQYLLDGIAVSNPVFGYPPLLINPLAAASVTVSPGFADAEYGGALAGVIDQAIRGGTERFSGELEYMTSSLAGKLGSTTNSLSGVHFARGYLSGPMPFAGGAIRYSIAGHLHSERGRVFQRDSLGWNVAGDIGNAQLVAKLTYAVRPTLLLSVAAVDERRRALEVDPGLVGTDTVAPPAVRDDAQFIVGRVEKRFTRTALSVSIARQTGRRETCSLWAGVCVTDRFIREPTDSESTPFAIPQRHPYVASGQYFGGERFTTNTMRADIIARLTDHREIRAGVYAAQHDIGYNGVLGHRWLQGNILTVKDAYRAKPFEFASYVHGSLEHDILTVHIGARYDYGRTGGFAFVNPRDPTNGTTAMEVCQGSAPGINETPYTYGNLSGLAACMASPLNDASRPILLDSAARVAQIDDMHAVQPRGVFSPRLGLSFPLTENSGMFLNVGRYSRAPVYHHAFRNTGTGTRAGFGEGTDGLCWLDRTRPGTNECHPNLLIDSLVPEFIGNPDLSFEMADGFEAGFTSRTGRAHSLDVSVFSNTQSHLPHIALTERTPDIGTTYGGYRGTIRAVLNNGSMTAFGFAVTLRQRVVRSMSYSVNYTWQRINEIGAPPDLVAEALLAGEPFEETQERLSARSRAHTLNGLISWQWRRETPALLGPVGVVLLRQARMAATVSLGSGRQLRGSAPAQCLFTPGACSAFETGVAGTGTLINLMYAKALRSQGSRWALIARVRNLLDVDDGSVQVNGIIARRFARQEGRRVVPLFERVALRRILTGISVSF